MTTKQWFGSMFIGIVIGAGAMYLIGGTILVNKLYPTKQCYTEESQKECLKRVGDVDTIYYNTSFMKKV